MVLGGGEPSATLKNGNLEMTGSGGSNNRNFYYCCRMVQTGKLVLRGFKHQYKCCMDGRY